MPGVSDLTAMYECDPQSKSVVQYLIRDNRTRSICTDCRLYVDSLSFWYCWMGTWLFIWNYPPTYWPYYSKGTWKNILRFDNMLIGYHGQGRRDKVHGRYTNASSAAQKLSSRAFRWYMTTLYCSIYVCHIPLESSWAPLFNTQRYATLSRCSPIPLYH